MRSEALPVALSLVKPTRPIAQAAGIALLETVLQFSLFRPASDKIIIQYQEPFPQSSDESAYISILDAYREFVISRHKLRKLCRHGMVEAKKVDGKWHIQRSSLMKWLSRSSK